MDGYSLDCNTSMNLATASFSSFKFQSHLLFSLLSFRNRNIRMSLDELPEKSFTSSFHGPAKSPIIEPQP